MTWNLKKFCDLEVEDRDLGYEMFDLGIRQDHRDLQSLLDFT